MERDTRTHDREHRHDNARASIGAEEGKLRMSNAMLCALVLVAALVSFTGITFSIQAIRDFTALTVFIYFITTMTYRNRYNCGKLRGRESKEYREAIKEYRDAVNEIPDTVTDDRIAAYCEEYKKRELADGVSH